MTISAIQTRLTRHNIIKTYGIFCMISQSIFSNNLHIFKIIFSYSRVLTNVSFTINNLYNMMKNMLIN